MGDAGEYRVRVRDGEVVEVEVAGPDAKWVDAKVDQLFLQDGARALVQRYFTREHTASADRM